MEALAGAKPLSSGKARRIARTREEMLGLLADFSSGDSDSDRELSFSGLVEVVSGPNASTADLVAKKDRGDEESPHLKQQQVQMVVVAAASREGRLRRRPSDRRGSCGDGVLLMPGLLTRSKTTARPCRRLVTLAAAGESTTSTVNPGKACRTMQAPLAVGCWPALWGRGRHRRSSSISNRV